MFRIFYTPLVLQIYYAVAKWRNKSTVTYTHIHTHTHTHTHTHIHIHIHIHTHSDYFRNLATLKHSLLFLRRRFHRLHFPSLIHSFSSSSTLPFYPLSPFLTLLLSHSFCHSLSLLYPFLSVTNTSSILSSSMPHSPPSSLHTIIPLVTSSTVAELKTKVHELKLNNEYQLKLKEMTYSEKVNC